MYDTGCPLLPIQALMDPKVRRQIAAMVDYNVGGTRHRELLIPGSALDHHTPFIPALIHNDDNDTANLHACLCLFSK